MSSEKRFDDTEESFEETDPLAEDDFHRLGLNSHRKSDRTRWVIACLALMVLIQTVALVTLARQPRIHDPSLGLWCKLLIVDIDYHPAVP